MGAYVIERTYGICLQNDVLYYFQSLSKGMSLFCASFPMFTPGFFLQLLAMTEVYIAGSVLKQHLKRIPPPLACGAGAARFIQASKCASFEDGCDGG